MGGIVQVFGDAPGNRDAVVGGRAPSYFIQQDQAGGRILLMMLAVSFISTMKVDSPPLRLSDAPTRVKILSVRGILAVSQGTKLPIWAHQGDEGGLPEQGAFTAHVRARKDNDLLGCRVQKQVIGNIGLTGG